MKASRKENAHGAARIFFAYAERNDDEIEDSVTRPLLICRVRVVHNHSFMLSDMKPDG